VVGKRAADLIPKVHRGQIAGPDFPEEEIANLFLGEGPIVRVGLADNLDKLFGALTYQILHVFLLFVLGEWLIRSMFLTGGPLEAAGNGDCAVLRLSISLAHTGKRSL
ncbi:MAG: hypothetical protein ABSC19_11035, partial [Syntrophorhabdales bacterium]